MAKQDGGYPRLGRQASGAQSQFKTVAAAVITLAVLLGQSVAVLAQQQTDPEFAEIAVAIPGHFPPQYLLGADGAVSGFAIDVAEGVGALANIRFRYVVTENWMAAHAAIQSGLADILVNNGISEQRKLVYDFTAPVETFRVSLFVREDSQTIADWDDLRGRKVVLGKTNAAVRLLRARDGIDLLLVNNAPEALFALLSGQADAMVYPEPVAWKTAREARVDGRIKVVGSPLIEIKRAMSVRKGESELFARLDRAVRVFVASEAYQSIYAKWYGRPTPFWSTAKIVTAMGALLLCVTGVLAWWRYHTVVSLNRRLRRNVTEQKRAESALYESEASLLNAQRIANLGNWDWNIVSGGLHWSDQIYRIFGLEPRAFAATYEAFVQLIHPGDRDAVQAAVNRALDQREPYAIDHRIVLPDGEERFVHEQGEVVFDEAGTPLRMTGTVQDITAQRRAEQEVHDLNESLERQVEERTAELRESEGRLALAIQSANFGTWSRSVPDDRVIWDKRTEEIFGMKPDAFEGTMEAFLKLIHPDDRERITSGHRRLIEEGLPYAIDFRITWPNGELRHISTQASVVRGDRDSSLQIIGMIYDVTERKRAEEALRESEGRLALAAQSANFGTWSRFIPSDRVIWDERTEAIYGLEPGTFEGTMEAVLGRVHPDDRENIKTGQRRLLEEGLPYAVEFRIFLPNGETRYVGTWASVVRSDQDSSQLIIGITHDITDRKRAEEALRDSEEQLRLITDNVPAAIAYISENQRYRFINKHYEEWFSISSEEAQGRFIGDVLGEATHNAIKDNLAKALSGELVAFETNIQTTDAGIRDVQPTYVPHFTDDGAVKGVFVLVTDITERKRLESEVLRQERLATLGQLTATVSHELRNPLGVIRTSAFTLRSDINPDAPRAVRALERVERSVIRCDRIIDELLDFTRISGLEPEPTVLDDWLDGVLEEQVLPADVVLRRDSGLPAMAVSFDRDRFRRAVINVFDNACQVMLGEHLAETASGERVLTVRTQARDGRIEVIFEDQGPGIPVDIHERIFEPMFSTKGFGVGLGLPVVKQIMERHGGGIEIESEQGRGTTVRLWLDPKASHLDANNNGSTA